MKKLRHVLLGTVTALCCTIAVNAAPPSGTWLVNSSGWSGFLVINVDNAGHVTGTIFGDPIKGTWTEASQGLVFYRETDRSTSLDTVQIYKAHQVPVNHLQPDGDQYLTGHYERLTGGMFGWFASR